MSAARPVKSNRRMVVAIVVMVLLWLGIILLRNEIRVRWWAYRLARSERPEAQTAWLARLLSLGETSLPAAEWLLEREDPAVRSFALPILHHVRSEESRALLVEAAGDADGHLRGEAIRGLAFHGDQDTLARIARTGEPVTACRAVLGLAAIGSDQALEILADLAGAAVEGGRLAVRVEALQVLGELEARRAVGVLTECLDDDTVFSGWTVAERDAAEALAEFDPRQRLAEPEPRTLGDFAARALERIGAAAGGEPRP